MLALSALVVLTLLHFREPMAQLGSWGYLGAFLAEMGNSAAVVVPTPGPAYTFTMGASLNPFHLGLIGGVGAALGEVTGYILGVRGRRVLERGRIYRRVTALTKRWTGVTLAIIAILPFPFEVVGVWAGATRYSLWRFLVFVAMGKVVRVTGIALAGYYGIGWLILP